MRKLSTGVSQTSPTCCPFGRVNRQSSRPDSRSNQGEETSSCAVHSPFFRLMKLSGSEAANCENCRFS